MRLFVGVFRSARESSPRWCTPSRATRSDSRMRLWSAGCLVAPGVRFSLVVQLPCSLGQRLPPVLVAFSLPTALHGAAFSNPGRFRPGPTPGCSPAPWHPARDARQCRTNTGGHAEALREPPHQDAHCRRADAEGGRARPGQRPLGTPLRLHPVTPGSRDGGMNPWQRAKFVSP